MSHATSAQRSKALHLKKSESIKLGRELKGMAEAAGIIEGFLKRGGTLADVRAWCGELEEERVRILATWEDGSIPHLHRRHRDRGAINTPPSLETLALEAPGAIGEFVKWSVATAPRPQPEYSLAAAMAFFGTLFARKIKGHTGLLTNVSCVSVGATADGKDHPLGMIDLLADAAGVSRLIEGEIASDAGVIAAVADHPECLFIADEWGHHIAAGKSKNAGSHEAKIVSNLMAMFSAAQKTYRSKAYADRRDRAKVEIHNPCVCLMATTTKTQLFKTITRDDIETGFMPRLNLFFRDMSRPLPAHSAKDGPKGPPDTLVEFCKAWASYAPPQSGRGNLTRYIGPPAMLGYEPDGESFALLEDTTAEIDAKRAQLGECPESSLWSRTIEHAHKFALIASAAMNLPPERGTPILTGEAAEWAINLAERLTLDMIEQSDRALSDNETERSRKYVLDAIAKAGRKAITQSELTNKTPRLNAKDRTSIINELIESDRIVRLIRPSTGGRNAFSFQLLPA